MVISILTFSYGVFQYILPLLHITVILQWFNKLSKCSDVTRISFEFKLLTITFTNSETTNFKLFQTERVCS